ncbi:MAG: hypothetical protein C4534_01565 [Gaiellales bacterium]|nr:MAG: hypothetical protein C4534_01565 [Gaiellales bacterium]
MPVGCPQLTPDEQERIQTMKSILNEVGYIGKVYTGVSATASRAWHAITGGLRSVDAELVETSLVRITEGQSRELGAQLRAYYAALKLMRLQAAHYVRNALNMHNLPSRLVSRLLHLQDSEDGAIRKVERAGRDITGDGKLEFVRSVTPKFAGRVEEHFSEGGFVARLGEAALDAVAALFGRTRMNREAQRFIAAVEKVTGLQGNEAHALARKLWKRHGDLFATGVTRKGDKTPLPDGTKRNTTDIARAVLQELASDLDTDTASALTRWLSRASELAVDKKAFPGGKQAAVDSVLLGTDARVAEKVKRMLDFVDRESWSSRYSSRLTPFGFIASALFLNGVLTPVRQLSAFATALADLGMMAWAEGVATTLPRFARYLGHKGNDPVDWAITLALQEGGGGVGGVAVPGVLATDRVTRLTNAGAAAHDFKIRLGRLRQKYSRLEAADLPKVGEDADIDRLRNMGFTENHIARIINSKYETPKLALAYYTLRSTDIGTGTPDAFNVPPAQENIAIRTLLPFSRFAVRMGSNVYQRMYHNEALRNWMKSRTGGNPHPTAQAEAIAQGWKERVSSVLNLDYRYIFALAGASGLYEEVILDNVEDALGLPSGINPTLFERTEQLIKQGFETGEVTPEMVREEFAAMWGAIDEVGALGVFFSLWERQFGEGKPADAIVEEMVGRAPSVRMLGTLQTLAMFTYAAAKNAGAVNSEDFYLLVARDMPQVNGPFLSQNPNLLGSTQFDELEHILSNFDDEQKRWVTDYLREQTMGKVMARLYAFPLIRNDYMVATQVNTEHHTRLLIETLIRARNMSMGSQAGGVWRFPGPGDDTTTVPPVSERWQDRKYSLHIMESALMARYDYKTKADLYQKLIIKEYLKRAVGQTIVQATAQIPEEIIQGDESVTPSITGSPFGG